TLFPYTTLFRSPVTSCSIAVVTASSGAGECGDLTGGSVHLPDLVAFGDVQVTGRVGGHRDGGIQARRNRRSAVPAVCCHPVAGRGGDETRGHNLADAVLAWHGDVQVPGAIGRHGARPGNGSERSRAGIANGNCRSRDGIDRSTHDAPARPVIV